MSLRESGPENWICTGFLTPLFKSSITVYSAPTTWDRSLRRSTESSEALRFLSVLLPMST